jgi:RNA polymerase sigma-70 factor (ECF subfamily)
MIEDKLNLLRLKQGSRKALRRIYDKYRVDLLKLAVSLTGDIHVAEDLIHDVFVTFSSNAHRLTLVGSLKGYLITSVVNRVRNHRRDDARRHDREIETGHASPGFVCGPVQWAILGEQLLCLSQALKELPYEQREVITLHMEMNMTFSRIALLQETSVNTVKGRYRYAIKKLRSLLNGELSI